ncbi:aminodeoxychorismate synthase, component I [Haloplanus aerogenes]|uniref:anthranilate synthase n=1 Tax=Haloplanus aerogenes TaxID=660522 RepID=A0A3G8R0U5_9EURY|nr:aminodeoxychorismate synthase, component I [Haloplanus aerogenes]AZH26624.1 aminodeoxychorismate synthase, component I [Haloplanus aerogenes]RMB12857.1 anthranilate synthase component 1 [Haloplanus aerogenes]
MSDGPTVVTSLDAFRAVAAEATPGTRVPVVVTLEADPFEAYRRARGDAPSVFFETSGGQPGWGYFGVDPDFVREVAGVELGDGGRTDGESVLDTITELVDGESLARGDCEIPYPGGFFGWLSYDTVREIETLPSTTVDDRGLPHLQLARYTCLAAWRAGESTLHLVATPRVGDDSEGPDGDPVAAAYERGVDRALALAEAATTGDPSVGAPSATGPVSFTSSCDRSAYADRVRQVQTYIRDGDTFQANISHRLTAPAAVHPVEAFAALRAVNPAPYSGLIEFPGVDLVSASPELLLERDGDHLRTEPIAGTRPRGETDAADRRLEADLRSDEKERAEHAMLVDLERNDLGKVSEYGSVTVDEYRRVDRYSEVFHLVSEVTGTMAEKYDLGDAIGATFPGGTITGAPKPRTMEIIDEVETHRRGPYTGSMAAIGFDGRATLNIIIRTLVRHGDEYHLRVGGGVVHDSVPDREYDETLAKARALVNAVDTALGDEMEMEVTGK